MYKVILLALLLCNTTLFAQQKKPLTQQVYDGWKSLGERIISPNGQYICYTINPQEGDGQLIIQHLPTGNKKTYARGYAVSFSASNEYAYFKIKPYFAATRQAKIKKKKTDEMPKDSFAIVTLATDSVVKIPSIKSYKIPEKATSWVAYLADKATPITATKKTDSLKFKIDILAKLADSIIKKSIDSIKGNIEKQALINAAQKAVNEIYKNADALAIDNKYIDAEADDNTLDKPTEGTELTILNKQTGSSKQIKLVSDYYFNKSGTALIIKTTKNAKDSNSKAYIMQYALDKNKLDTLLKGYNDAKNFVYNEDGNQFAFVAERDSSAKALQKYYKLYLYLSNISGDTATIVADKNKKGLPINYTISEYADLKFSKDGTKLYFGTAPIIAPKDTTLVDFELARLDVWHYKDDYLQPQQLKELAKSQKINYTAMLNIGSGKVIQLGSDSTEIITLVNEGNAKYVLAQSTKNNRVASQWQGNELTNAYVIFENDGTKKLIKKNSLSSFRPSPQGKYIYWYDYEQKQYYTYEVATAVIKNVTIAIKVPLYDTENDVPDYPSPAGFTGWIGQDEYMLINDEFDIWKVDPRGNKAPQYITKGQGRKNNTVYNYINTDTEKRYFTNNDTLLLSSFNKQNKMAGFATAQLADTGYFAQIITNKASFSNPTKAKNAAQFIFTKSSIASTELYTSSNFKNPIALTNLSEQQQPYVWLTAELLR